MAYNSKAQERGVPLTVLNIGRRTAAEITSLTGHCNRTIGDISHCDPEKTNDNVILVGTMEPLHQQGLRYMKSIGAKSDARNVKPYTSIVAGASPEYFRPHDPTAKGEYVFDRMEKWVAAAMKWAEKQFAKDLIYAELHLDESTPHIHFVVVPSVQKGPNIPKRRRKTETEKAFLNRCERARKARPSIPTKPDDGESAEAFQARVKKVREWAPNIPTAPRPAETVEAFKERVIKAKSRKSKRVLSHHSHPLFGGGFESYSNVLDTYADAVKHLGIERGAPAERDDLGRKVSPTTKKKWADDLLKRAEEAETTASAAKARADKIEAEAVAYEFGSKATITDVIKYRPARESMDEGLVVGPNGPREPEQIKTLIEKIRPAYKRVVNFAKQWAETIDKLISLSKEEIIHLGKKLRAREAELNVISKIDEVEFDVERDKMMSASAEKLLRDEGIIQDKTVREPVLQVRYEVIKVMSR